MTCELFLTMSRTAMSCVSCTQGKGIECSASACNLAALCSHAAAPDMARLPGLHMPLSARDVWHIAKACAPGRLHGPLHAVTHMLAACPSRHATAPGSCMQLCEMQACLRCVSCMAHVGAPPRPPPYPPPPKSPPARLHSAILDENIEAASSSLIACTCMRRQAQAAINVWTRGWFW